MILYGQLQKISARVRCAKIAPPATTVDQMKDVRSHRSVQRQTSEFSKMECSLTTSSTSEEICSQGRFEAFICAEMSLTLRLRSASSAP